MPACVCVCVCVHGSMWWRCHHTGPLVLNGHTEDLQQPVEELLEGLVAGDAEQEALVRSIGDLMHVRRIGTADVDGEHDHPLLPQLPRGLDHVVRRVPVRDHHGDLGHALCGATAPLWGEEGLLEEGDGLAREGASIPMLDLAHLLQQRGLVHVVLQQELLVGLVAVLRHAHTHLVRAHIEVLYELLEEEEHLLEALWADAGGAVQQEHDVRQ